MPEDLMIPEQHAYETGNVVTPRVPASEMAVAVSFIQNGRSVQASGAAHFSHLHNAAAILHGWGKRNAAGDDEPWGHRHHAGEPIKLTRADYLKALEAAGTTDEHGEYVPHPGALSPHAEAHAHHKAHAEHVARIKADRERAEAEAKHRAEHDAAEKKAAEERAKAHTTTADAGKGRGSLDRGQRQPSVSPPAAPTTAPAAPAAAPEPTEASKV